MVIPTFVPAIPVGTQTLGNTVVSVNNNFGNYNGLIAVNHFAPNSTNQGKHTWVELPVFGSISVPGPFPITFSGEGGLFTETLSGSSELYYQRDGATGSNFQMTGPFVMNIGSPTNGSVVLYGGLIMKWGKMTAAGTITFASPFLNNCFGVTALSNAGSAVTIQISAVTLTNFNAQAGVGNPSFYIALGN